MDDTRRHGRKSRQVGRLAFDSFSTDERLYLLFDQIATVRGNPDEQMTQTDGNVKRAYISLLAQTSATSEKRPNLM